MLRGSLLAAALFALLGLGSGTGHVRNGRIAYEHAGNADRFQIYTVTATGAHRRHLTSGRTYSRWDAVYSPNGKRIAFVRASNHAIELWTMNADGSTSDGSPRRRDPRDGPGLVTGRNADRVRRREPAGGAGHLGHDRERTEPEAADDRSRQESRVVA
jgi:hypothetical protein